MVFFSYFLQLESVPSNLFLFQCMMGGAWFEELFGSADSVTTSQLETVALESLREQLNITTEPNKVVSSVLKVRKLVKVTQTEIYCKRRHFSHSIYFRVFRAGHYSCKK